MRKTSKIDVLSAIVYMTVPGAAAEMDKLLNIPPSDCSQCRHKHHPEGGHCYMFRNKPKGNCGQYDQVKPKSDDTAEVK